ncbi:MAG: RNA methyltransferase [Actinobacteria bacterium]|nr:RNA methyltransferase [Actinomycetota bacterium]
MITSSQNEQIKELRKLRDKKHRSRSGLFAAEGEDLVAAALAAAWEPRALFCTEDSPTELVSRDDAVLVDADVLDGASALGSGSRVIGVFEQREPSLELNFSLAVYLEGIADPGNIGTVMRSALAFSDGPVILSPDCADPYSPKAVRACMGAVFARPPVRCDVAQVAELPVRRVALDGAAPLALHELARVDAAGLNAVSGITLATPAAPAPGESNTATPTVICIGAERAGLSRQLLAAADETVSIPMRAGGPESLNAAIAASIALYELGGALQSAVHEAPAPGAGTGITASTEK